MSDFDTSTEYQTIIPQVKYDSEEIDIIYNEMKSVTEVSSRIESKMVYNSSTDTLHVHVCIPNDLSGLLYLYMPDYDWYELPDLHRILKRSMTRFTRRSP